MNTLNPFLDADLELERRVVNFLAGQHIPALRALKVKANNGAITLRGNVKSFHEKQLGQHSARRVAGVRQVIDEVEVTWPMVAKLQSPNSADISPARRHSADRVIV